MLNLETIRDRQQIYQLIVAIVAVTAILIGCLIILAPFFPAILLATIFTLATWPAFVWLKSRLRNKTAITALLMTMMLAACFVVPLFIIGTSIADNYTKIYSVIQQSLQGDLSSTGALLKQAPYIGEHLEKYWTAITSDKERINAFLQSYAKDTSQMVLRLGTTVGHGLLDLTLGVLISYFFFRHGTYVAVRTRNLIETFAGEQGKHLLAVSKNTLVGVVYGILGTALAQGVLATFGFWVSGIPGATFLGLMTFFLSLLPMGPPLIWVPAVIWLLTEGLTGWGIFLLLWGLLVISSIDNFLKPYFISLGSNLPFMLVLLGIVGGVLAFGFIGIFIGPTILALTYSLVSEWSAARVSSSEPHA